MKDMKRRLGLLADGTNAIADRAEMVRYIRLKLAALGLNKPGEDAGVEAMATGLLADYRQRGRMLIGTRSGVDGRIETFLKQALLSVLPDGEEVSRLPDSVLELDVHGLARELSLPDGKDVYRSELLESVRLQQGVVHNPKSDRRTTQGVFHVCDVGISVPGDKLAVPAIAYARLLKRALTPPGEMMELPFAHGSGSAARTWVGLLLRPVVSPEIPGVRAEKRAEVRFLAPGGVVSNLDFVESIFGNAGDPHDPMNDAALDAEHWTGTTGCVIVAPHLPGARKKDLGLPHVSKATARQKREGMCWEKEDEIYNDGRPFKITCRDKSGVMVTILGDNYFGYCKKEVKTQIGLASNLTGWSEEEHAGGALVFPSYSLGDSFQLDSRVESSSRGFAESMALLGNAAEIKPEGYAVDRNYDSIVYVPSDVRMDLADQRVRWKKDGKDQAIKLLPGKVYVLPGGYKVRLEKHPGAPSWRLVGTVAEGTFCHKPCTVSGGGKSEISKSISDAIVYGAIYVGDWAEEMKRVKEILDRDYKDRYLPGQGPDYSKKGGSRKILSAERSLGSVIKLLTPSPGEYTPAYNAWLETIPNNIRALVFLVKRFYKPEWGENWQEHFRVTEMNGAAGHELLLGKRKLVGSYLRVGFNPEGDWRLYKLRQDFIAADKVQMEDDISASVVAGVSGELAELLPEWMKERAGGAAGAGGGAGESVKLVKNCEYRLFQRPDEAIHRGYDKQAEMDLSTAGLFCSNFQPLTAAEAREIVEDAVGFDSFTEPVKRVLRDAAAKGEGHVVCSAMPRIVDGKPTKNPRYLQTRPDVAKPRDAYLADVGARLRRGIKADQPVIWPVSAVLSGRRNNPPEEGVRPLAVYSPIHYQELPELFMEYICSLTGKSPSTTGAGSEGAMTKGPFNALPTTADLNTALLSFVLCGHDGFSTAAGCVGPHVRVDHDVSLLIPELWARLRPEERTAKFLIDNGHLEKLEDFEHKGKKVLASRLGWRISSKFVHTFMGRLFDSPATVFPERLLRPEKQDMDVFVDGVLNITEAQEWVAKMYFEDGVAEQACPPLKALLHVMAYGTWEGKTASDPAFRALFDAKAILSSDWYTQRLLRQQAADVAMWEKHVVALEGFSRRSGHEDLVQSMGISKKLEKAKAELARCKGSAYLAGLKGTVGLGEIS